MAGVSAARRARRARIRLAISLLLLPACCGLAPTKAGRGATSPPLRQTGARTALWMGPDDCDRRVAIRRCGALATGGMLAAGAGATPEARALEFLGKKEADGEVPKPSKRPTFLSVEMDKPPFLQPYTRQGERRAISELGEANAVVYGLHGGDGCKADVALAQRFLQDSLLKSTAGVAVGLQAADPTLQSALDRFVEAPGSENEAFAALSQAGAGWNEEHFPLSAMKPLLSFCRRAGLPLVACGVPLDTLGRVGKSGLEALSKEERAAFVPDANLFLSMIKRPGYNRYAQSVILSGRDQGDNAFARAIVRHEAAAAAAARWLRDESASSPRRIALLCGEEDVKFGFGVAARLERLAPPSAAEERAFDVRTVLLNPTAADSMSPTPNLRLALGVSPRTLSESYPIANVIAFSESPPVNLLTRLQEPIR